MSDELANPNTWQYVCYSLPVIIPLSVFMFNKCCSNKYNTLKSKVVLITGASSGLGETLAHEFYSHGCALILTGRNPTELERVKSDLLSRNDVKNVNKPCTLVLDLIDQSTIEVVSQKVLGVFGRVDILINNAGISYRGRADATTAEVDYKVMLVNYFGQVALTKALLPSMIHHKSGHIVAISSVQGKIAVPFRSAYTASKHALQAFFDTLRAEISHHKVKVTVVSPGYIQTNLSLNALTGSGSKYGIMDESTMAGYSAEYVAQQIVEAVVDDEQEVIIAPLYARLAIGLRYIWPRLYFWIMKYRANRYTSQKM
ncbi:dehydrogenase/reductase SDR family protein 7-like [Daktulosphaira vitifoliae]|uniref:dehydrogenase/reductase SDR family protein 7-like n=1 Tax=Daktulosphaira vitifoliae TaxID=58002 RepID=UPI0021A9DEB1|nr:dehydrogenase/reductase SDR family protein 7-like [Daktulosphaira vitifoliae]